jgi:hypothetical protein
VLVNADAREVSGTEQPDRDLPPLIKVPPPGPSSRTWLVRSAHVAAPMGPIAPPGPPSGIVYATGRGSNVTDVDSSPNGCCRRSAIFIQATPRLRYSSA